jgi:hypothetical protein
VRFEVLMVASMKMAVFWVVAPCSLVEVYQLFTGACCLHHQGESTHCPDNRVSKHLWNVGQLLPNYMAQQPRRQAIFNSSYRICKNVYSIIYLSTKFHSPSYNGPSRKLKAKWKFHKYITLFYWYNKIVKLYTFHISVTVHHFRTL